MKVHGIVPRDLMPKDKAQFQGAEAKWELFERKRKHLVQTVVSQASEGLDSSRMSSALEDPLNKNAAFMEAVLKAEKANIERMARAAKKEVQKIVIQELEAKKTWKDGQQKQAESAQRMKVLLQERDKRIVEMKKEGTKKAERSAEVRNRADLVKAEENQKMSEKLREANERAENHIKAIAEAHHEHTVKKAEKRVMISKRQESYEWGRVSVRERMNESLAAKQDEVEERLEAQLALRESKSEEMLQKQRRSTEKVRATLEEKQKAIEANFFQICDRHEQAHKKREVDAVDKTKAFAKKNLKAFNEHAGRYERILTEADTNPQVSRRLSTMESPEGLARSSSDSLLATIKQVAEHRVNHRDLVKTNISRLRRARQHRDETGIEKLRAMREKTEFMLDSKEKANERRMVVLKNCAIEASHYNEQVQRVKDAGPARMLKILGDIDTEPEAKERINTLLQDLNLGSIAPAKEDEKDEKK